jgi:polysaccharide export outer membrane protein
MRKLTVISLSTILAVSGCTVVPGSGLPTGNKTIVYNQEESGDIQSQLDKRVSVHPITFSLVQSMAEPPKVGQANHALDQQKRNYNYRLGKGDVLSIVVWYQPDMTAQGATPGRSQAQQVSNGSWVSDRGTIFYPLVGEMKVEGKTIDQVRSELDSRLKRYIKNPQVDVTVSQFRSQRVSVSGSVRQAGQLPITNVPMTLIDAIDLAGGTTDTADPQNVKWTHKGVEKTISLEDLRANGDMSQNTLLSDGDIVYVPSNENNKVHVMGEVTRQSSLSMPPKGLSLTDALGSAEGMNQTFANATGVFVIRNVPNDYEKPIHVYQLNLKDASAYALGTQFKLRTDDVVYVTAAPIARWNRVVSQAIGAINTAATVNNSF